MFRRRVVLAVGCRHTHTHLHYFAFSSTPSPPLPRPSAWQKYLDTFGSTLGFFFFGFAISVINNGDVSFLGENSDYVFWFFRVSWQHQLAIDSVRVLTQLTLLLFYCVIVVIVLLLLLCCCCCCVKCLLMSFACSSLLQATRLLSLEGCWLEAEFSSEQSLSSFMHLL